MREITSVTNRKIVETAKLKEKKYRDLTDCYIVEGEKMVSEAFSCGQIVESVFTTDAGYADLCESCYLVPETVFSKISDTVSPQGILAVLKKPTPKIEEFRRCVILDGISDPGNMGTIIRTCAATGVTDIFAIDCTDAFSPKAVRSSMSGIYRVNVLPYSAEEVIGYLRERDIPIVIADMGGQNVFEASFDKFALAVGSEAHGISPALRNAADFTVALKMQNVESLNAAIALSVILYKLIS